ncbi:PD-(D/E)XK nuclease family protein [Coraliomargarita sp. SDUM461003]|uniref:PD-(D/E)XK nuclease family protein n=1 Tax=Thalassobacterium maritimum TaxID=3041265 RepID=A0ABU1AVQ6_9BACT|nr:PD-(D/E)XK nuclease family protein [Coraliomargarita sp. SDUM461003]MDQ8207354.1 PD-(D/E)XK nuclease family protein [Coraliomargarita sp. SDUM461003]
MNTDCLTTLFEELKQLEQSKPEATLLSIGGRGYYENPASDLLQFFLAPSNAHGLGSLFVDALLEVTGITVPAESLKALTVQREVHTENGNRIDLLLKAPGWILLIENKIWHDQINPFEDYEALAKQRMKPDDQEHYVILSPGGDSSQEGWQGLSYRQLIDALKVRLDTCDGNTKTSKWWHFAQDFVVHLDQELYSKAMTKDEIKFVEKNHQALVEAAKLQERYRVHLLDHLPAVIDAACPMKGAYAKVDSWCIRLHHSKWGASNIAWARDPQNDNRLRLTVYIESPVGRQLEVARKLFEDSRGMDYWAEANGRWQCWTTSASYESSAEAENVLKPLAVELFTILNNHE